ncbi:MAG TPA: hypothetical protein VFL14_00775 [Xanthomonadales bacterium]|nr:hypothetical protein [Xanthomonadales bacterium]
MRTAALLAASLMLAGPGAADAAAERWFLQDVTFADGGTATGSFTIDFESLNVSSFDVHTTGGGFSAQDYNPDTAFPVVLGNVQPGPAIIFRIAQVRDLRVKSSVQMANAPGGFAPLDINDTNYNVECFSCAPFRPITGGALVRDRLFGDAFEGD